MHDRDGDEYQSSAGIEVVYVRFAIEYPTEWPLLFGDFM